MISYSFHILVVGVFVQLPHFVPRNVPFSLSPPALGSILCQEATRFFSNVASQVGHLLDMIFFMIQYNLKLPTDVFGGCLKNMRPSQKLRK